MSKTSKANYPVITRYTVRAKGVTKQPLRVALVSDLHDRPFMGALDALRSEKPDLVLVAGDLMECYLPDDIKIRLADMDEQSMDESPFKRAVYRALVRADMLWASKKEPFDKEHAGSLSFLRESARLAPTFYSLGNHERFMPDDIRRAVIETGATLLDNASARITVRGTETLIGGLSSRVDRQWLSDFAAAQTNGIKLLICHHPEYYAKLLDGLNTGIVFSGHAHGGQLRLFGKPVFAPGQGLFPKYTGGVYHDRLVVSRGLSNTAHMPRFGNPTELVIVDIARED